jgi:TRAP-type C4-dicarboxylate transport system permease small subunit
VADATLALLIFLAFLAAPLVLGIAGALGMRRALQLADPRTRAILGAVLGVFIVGFYLGQMAQGGDAHWLSVLVGAMLVVNGSLLVRRLSAARDG